MSLADWAAVVLATGFATPFVILITRLIVGQVVRGVDRWAEKPQPRPRRRRTKDRALRVVQQQMRAVTAAQSGDAIKQHGQWKAQRRNQELREWREQWQQLDR